MNNKKDIEEDIKIYKEIIGNFKAATTEFTKDIFPRNAEALENILADRERLEKENVKMQVEIAEQVYFESMPIEEMKQLQVKANAYDSLVEKIKNKIQKYKKMKDNCNDNEIETKIRLDVKIIGYEELLDTEK